MSITEKETVLLTRHEVTPGVDALQAVYDASGGSTVGERLDDVMPYAISVLELDSTNENEFEDEEELGSGTQSSSTKAVGLETSARSFAQRLRAGNGDPSREPDWVRQMLASSWKKSTAIGFKISNAAMVADGTTGNTSFAHLYLGERLCGSVDVANAAGAWGDTEGGSGGPTADPQKGELVVIYPVGGSPDSPVATGRMAEDHTTGVRILVRLDRSDISAPASGMNIRVTLGGGGFAYSTLAEAMPLAFVTYFKNDGGTGTLRVAQQAGPALDGRKLVGQVSTAVVSSFDAPVAHGIVLTPESRASVEIDTTGAWSAGAPGVGRIVNRVDHISNTIASGKILAVSGNKITIKPFPLFGTFEDGGLLITLTDAGAATTATQNGAATPIGSPNMSIWDIVSGFRKRCIGAKGNASIQLEAGKPGRVNFSFEGGPGAQEDEIPIKKPTSLPNYAAPRWEGGIAEINGKRYTISQMGFDLGAEISRTESANADGGVQGGSTDSRNATLSVTQRRLGGADPWEAFRRSAFRCVAGAVLGKTDGNRISIVATNLQVESHSDSSDNGPINASLTFLAHGVGGDDEIILHLM